jgi:hypothetical protein
MGACPRGSRRACPLFLVILVPIDVDLKRLIFGDLRGEVVEHVGKGHEEERVAKFSAVLGVNDVGGDVDGDMDDVAVGLA